MELTIDTSSNIAGVILSHKGEPMASLTWQTSRNHTVQLLPTLTCLLRQARVELSSIEAIIVAKGPGSFNGLRVGISTAKGLASALNIPLVGINTLEAEAYHFAFTGLPLRPVHKAGREEIATALYRQKDDEWRCLEEDNLTTVRILCRRIRQKTLFCGEIPPDIVSEIQQSLGKRAIISQSNGSSRGSALATLGWRKLNRGEQDDPVTLQPVYLRPPHITKPRDKKPFFVTPSKAKEANEWKSRN
ncbi:MAG: tRNA (adenosine(37)-N6)-threonylcarbamoyltransferase complex dimerization subunit type 1 TsaB [Dehalococcoidia bacterium]